MGSHNHLLNTRLASSVLSSRHFLTLSYSLVLLRLHNLPQINGRDSGFLNDEGAHLNTLSHFLLPAYLLQLSLTYLVVYARYLLDVEASDQWFQEGFRGREAQVSMCLVWKVLEDGGHLAWRGELGLVRVVLAGEVGDVVARGLRCLV